MTIAGSNAVATPVRLHGVAALLIDMDGTLINSQRVTDRCWRDWCDRRGVSPAATAQLSLGRVPIDVMRTLAPHLPDTQLLADAAAFNAREVADIDGIVALPGAGALLEQAVDLGVPVALVTSAARSVATVRMAAAGLPFPSVGICADDVTVGKPDPDGYRQAAAALSVPARDCVVLEDSPAGVAAGHAAGSRVIGIGPQARTSDAHTDAPNGIRVLQETAGTFAVIVDAWMH